jgi:branched-chain amino acid transport system permease protein
MPINSEPFSSDTARPLVLARPPLDWRPIALVVAIAVIGLPLVHSPSTWLTLTVAGLAMGMIIFTAASGLTLIFGLMDVLNFGHGVFISLGAFVGFTVFGALSHFSQSPRLDLNLTAIAVAVLVATFAAALVGLIFERIIIRPVYGEHLKQILITTGGLIIGEELIKAIWGPEQHSFQIPPALSGAFIWGDAAIEKYRILAVVIGLLIYAALWLALTRTKIGLLVRAGVEDRDMVASLGYRIDRLFIGVFVVGSALAGAGGVLWGLYQEVITPGLGARLNVLIFIVIIIGGLGSVGGSFVGAVLVGLVANYAGFLAPKVALFSNILLMLLILMWRPRGLYPVAKR